MDGTTPTGWKVAKIGEVGEVRLGRQRSPKNRSSAYPTKYLRAGNLTWAGVDLADVMDMEFQPRELEIYRLHPGDVLLSEASGSAGEVGKSAIWAGQIDNCCFQNTVVRFRSHGSVTPKFAHAVFSHFARNGIFARISKGVGIHHLSADRFSQMEMPVPPLAEQDRIVAKIEELFSDLDAGVTAMERVRAKLKRYRASVLNAAVTGKMTEEWRKQNPPTEMADKLLVRILDARRKTWESQQLRKFSDYGKTPPKGWREKYQPPQPPNSPSQVLPGGWVASSVDQITENLDGQRVPVKSSDRDKRGGQYPYYGASGIIDHVDAYLFDGEFLLIAEDGANLLSRNTPIAFKASGKFWVNNHAHIVRTFCGTPLSYIEHFFNATQLQFWVTGSAQPKLTQANLNRIAVPLPPLREQHVIVEEVERRLSVVDAVEAEIDMSLKRAARLRQSILKRAFEGKLVPQIAGEQPAPVGTPQPEIERPGRVRGRARRSAKVVRERRKHRKGIVFDRGAVMSRVVRRLGRSPHFGRTEAMKTLYVGEAWLGIDLELEPVREKRGPLDKAIYKIESLAQKQRWFTTKKVGPMFRYYEGPNIENRLKAAERLIGDKLSEFDRLLDEMEKLDTDRAELFATTFAVWNDLLLDQREADEASIVSGVHEWHPSKIEKFPADRIGKCIKWMNEKRFIPTGRGPRSELLLASEGGDDEEG